MGDDARERSLTVQVTQLAAKVDELAARLVQAERASRVAQILARADDPPTVRDRSHLRLVDCTRLESSEPVPRR